MATFAGHEVPAVMTTVGENRNSIYEAPVLLDAEDAWLASGFAAGPQVHVQVDADGISVNEDGYIGPYQFGIGGFGGLFYNRIIITPEVVDVGNLMSPVVRTVTIWNSFLQNRSVAEISEEDTDGLAIESAFDIPGVLGPLQEEEFYITATMSGPNQIDATYTWVIGGVEYSVDVYGNRVIVFPFFPDWSDNVVDELSWLTTVERSYSGIEQRRSLREIPRRKTEFTVTVRSPHEAQYFENLIHGWQSRVFAVPLPTDGSFLTAGTSIGATRVYLDTADRGLYTGQFLLLFTDIAHYESIEIQDVGAGYVDLIRPVANAWPVGTRAVATELAHLGNQQSVSRLSDYYISARLAWQFSVSASAANIHNIPAPNTYRSLEAWLVKSDWSVTPEFTYENPFIVHGDGDMGLLEWEETSEFTSHIRQHRWTIKSRAQAEEFRSFLGRCRGRRNPFWMPTWTTDFFITDSAVSTSSSISVRDNGYRSFSSAGVVRRDIAIFLKGVATPIMRRIMLVEDNFDGTVSLTLDAALGQSFTPDAVSRICLMGLYRLGSDSVSTQWLTSSVATVTLNVVLVRE